MYIYMGMFFNSQEDAPDFGSITMYFVGNKDLGYVEEGHKRFRKYAFQSTDLSKLSLITNALDGSEAFAVDTGTTYVLYNGQWSVKTTGLGLSNGANITSIDYQIVTILPVTGEKGIIYLVNNNYEEDNIYDEYIWVNDNYEKIGSANIDLTNYIQKVKNANNKIPKFDLNGALISTDFELNKTVPSDALFTDTTYTLTQDQFDKHQIIFTSSTGNSTTITIPDNNTTYSEAIASSNGIGGSSGFLSAIDKEKIDNLPVNLKNIVALTQNEYNNLSSIDKNTLYIITEEEN